MSISTIAFLYPGAMGASLARVLHQRHPHLTLLTSLTNRSQSTLDRATASGLQNVSLSELVTRSDLIISILPPSAALTLAREIVEIIPTVTRQSVKLPIYIDANAISPDTVSDLAGILRLCKIPFIDGSVIGLPAKEDGSFVPKLYLSAAPEVEETMGEVVRVLNGGDDVEAGKGLRVFAMEGAGEGGASALKMCYGGINKGLIGLGTIAILAAQAHSPGTATALLNEFASSKSETLRGFTQSIPDSINKAYRWVGEMEEISSFVTSSLRSSTTSPSPADTFQGLAQVFQRVADAYKAQDEGSAKENDVKTLLGWTDEAKKVLTSTKKG
ncbi:hypothetical protein CI109_101947 [Kwoniella shandongensis]|uniref:Uncharacterized protein n=1 Tax=Kwoniella shandongensis TaxID=1734106 RepID=A0A5M6BZ65_9TREE|nr:uncharacterized protein CI109_005393 [Kwoniella shandongensis]KAA5526269.1 hypothetical protein CI109_005393 [Kwoniella shandongensis]